MFSAPSIVEIHEGLCQYSCHHYHTCISQFDYRHLTVCPHTKQFIPKLYNETLYKESSYKFQGVLTQETSYKESSCKFQGVHTHKKVILKLYSETSYSCAVCYCGHEMEEDRSPFARGQVKPRPVIPF